MAYIYIATNPTLWHRDENGEFTPLIKIGYTNQADIDQRMNQLNRETSAAGRFVKYASYEIAPISGAMPDKLVHKIIQSIDPTLRLDENKEYFIWRPENAYKFFSNMARLHGCENKLVRYDGTEPVVTPPAPPHHGDRLPPVNLARMGILTGTVLQYKADPRVECVVISEKKVQYQGQVYSLTKLAQLLRNRTDAVQGTLWFTYQGRTIAELWAEYCAGHPLSSSD